MGDKITLDTNLLHEYWKDRPKRQIVQQLIDLASASRIELAVTSRIRQDVPDPPLSNLLDKLGDLGILETGSVTRVGLWRLGLDQLGDDALAEFIDRMSGRCSSRGIPEPDWRDWDHIHAHYVQGRDVFLTWDRAILSLTTDLADEFALKVMKPEDYLQHLDEE